MTTEEQRTDGQAADQDEAPAAAPVRKRTTRQRTTAAKGEAKPAKPRTTAKRAGGAAAASASGDKQPTRRRRTTRAAAAEAATAEDGQRPAKRLPRLQERLRTEVGPAMVKEFGYTSSMQVPRLDKVVLNIGMGESLENARAMEAATKDLSLISGQRPVTTRARKSIASFKIRQGMAVGLSVTVRGRRMYEFMDRLISSALPRVRDFRGVSREAFDGRGNYALGIREQVIFPEIDYNTIDRIRSLQVVIGTTARTDQEGLRLLEMLGMPFARPGEPTRVA